MKKLLGLGLAVALACEAQATSLISLNFSGELTDLERQTFVDAAEFWNSTITGYLLTSDGNGNPTPHGLTITASLRAIDGPGNVLGGAGPQTIRYYDNDPFTPNPTIALYYATTGIIEFDTADVSALIASNTLYGAVLHEMAHVLGIGSLWEDNNNVNNTNYQLYLPGSGQYTGTHALAQWRSEFNQPGATYIPVELAGGNGTAEGHWNENDFGLGATGIISADTGLDLSQELMTGWASSTFFISRATLGALEDLGYIVDYSKAGVVNHVVTVPEIGSLMLVMVSLPWFLRRKRRA
jgi:hypothetical protein